ncbi:unnamed protein product [Spirodela intermedia]|uniref:RRM domain-containing protein n=1 Tax=Spirodela intermedia TaxID=51605 RepID=A0A7I8J1P8_SPIIN|nr:unnamed protein product [Spirodela intermedia]CAA6664144.1 unnamed protein product [Spirodela intermedia]
MTVRVLNISSKVTLQELTSFFSFCGTVDDIKLTSADERNRTHTAVVSFRQPYAFQTALLLDGALLADCHVRVLPVENSGETGYRRVPINGGEMGEKQRMRQGGRELLRQAKTAATTAEQAVGRVGTTIAQSNCFTKSAIWLSGVLDRASKSAAELGSQSVDMKPASERRSDPHVT